MTPAVADVLVKEIMTPNVITVHPETSVDEVARLLFNHRITGMPVVDSSNAVLGIVSEFDVISKKGQVAADIMSRDLVTVDAEAAAEEVANILTSRHVRRVPVMSEGRLVGIVSRADLVRLFTITRWSCQSCGYFVRGFHKPEVCEMCGSTNFELHREPPGM